MDPPFEKILKEWDTIITMGVNQIAGETKVTAYIIQFEVDGFQFDILRASNYPGPNSCGRSSIIEYLAVKAEQEEEAAINDKLSILRAFGRFLNRLTKYQQIDIIFLNFYDHKLVSNCDKPYIIDPTNPYNNLFGNLPHRFLPTLATCSKETLQRLQKYETNAVVQFEKLFEPQPDLYSLFRSQMNRNRINTIMSVSQNCNEKSKRLIVRRNTFDSKIFEKIKHLMNFL
ncbi:unnamed protein product [Rotaria magnacalcarata]|uniref:Uncharacterized protein n=1 Tax=Rotaria magnacalcarata TaxID=392030 RepID=A0A8S2NXS4_9BILA|nr:unnamed protein product [Rotaria magnacalcarata]